MLRSRPYEGTTAEIWLPAASGVLQAAAEPVPTPALPSANDVPQPLRILAVDDDALVLLNTATMLEELGHEVTSAHSGAAALSALAERAYDVVITDHAMPQMTGTALAGEIARRWPQTHVVLATGYAELPASKVTGLPRLSKPFMQADLARMLAGLN